MASNHFNYFKHSIEGIELPEKFTFPFYYDPHELSKIAAQELQDYLQSQTDFEHNFGLDEVQTGLVIGKMFGVLVVQNTQNEIGYISAFSGKLANSNQHPYFVPPLFDMLLEDGFYRKGEEINISVNNRVEAIEKDPKFIQLKAQLKEDEAYSTEFILSEKKRLKQNKKDRSVLREQRMNQLSTEELEPVLEELRQQSLKDHYYLTDLVKYWKYRILNVKLKIAFYEDELQALKIERKQRSIQLQNELFDQYHFLNAHRELRSLRSIFSETPQGIPPSGAGECAAPKLLQYAFANDLKPIALAEFWWGASPKSEIRQHGQFYPSCKHKCEPILGHMLQGLEMDENPLLLNPAEGKVLEIVYEDDQIVIINKPAEFLSVPGKTIIDSVQTRMQEMYPDASGPLLVHRIDMSTSGILLVAKNKNAHQYLQDQFIRKTVKKRYVALLDGELEKDRGIIELSLRLDIEDRPRQLVCFEHGKHAKTNWKVKERRKGQTLVYFYPVTGRTHQLRVHAAHQLGLGTPIVGDDLYGQKANRLHLHAESIEFKHPTTREIMKIKVKSPF